MTDQIHVDAQAGTVVEREGATLPFAVAFALLVTGAVTMGISPVFVRYSEVGPFASAFWRVLLALPVLFVWAYLETRHRGINWRLPRAILLSGLFFSGDLVFWHLAIVNTTMANATLMATLAPVWVVLFSRAFIGEEVGRNAYYGLAICLAGAFLLIGSSYRVEPERIVGDLYGLITSLFFGLYFLAVRVGRRTHRAGEITFLSTLVTASVLLVVALISGNSMLPQTLGGVAALVALGTISHAGGQGLLAVALGSLSAAFSSLVIFVEALAAALFGWLIFSEGMTPGQIGGGALILVGVWVARPRARK